MIEAKQFYDLLNEKGITFYTGVPDSLLKDFCSYVNDNSPEGCHIINANEGSAIAIAAGHYFSTGNPAAVYMQNSGFGNAVNPLVSLADKEVYGVPVLLIIGWRGEPGVKDEPQHLKQGRIMTGMLEAMEIPFSIIDKSTTNLHEITGKAFAHFETSGGPYAVLVREGTFAKYLSKQRDGSSGLMTRENAIEIILGLLPEESVVVSTTGKASREVFEIREKKRQNHESDFLTVGSMGHCSQIAMGIATNNKQRAVFVLDGDGAVIMHMGCLAVSGTSGLNNFKHIVLNNESHESVGGQPTAASKINLAMIANACGYKFAKSVSSPEELLSAMKEMIEFEDGPSFLEVKVSKGSRSDLGRPRISPKEGKENLMKYLRADAN